MSDAASNADFIGRGMVFPMRIDAAGSIAMAGGAEGIESAIRMVLMTAPSERLMRPQFGCRIWDLMFEPVNANTLGLMAEAVREALSQWEPRAVVEDVVVEPDPVSPDRVYIRIDYLVRDTNDRRNLVYPFYMIPHEP